MKTVIVGLFSLLIAICSVGCKSIDPSERIVAKSFDVSGFSQLEVLSPYEVCYEQSADSTWSVEVTAPENILPHLQVKTIGHRLILSVDKDLPAHSKFDVKAVVVAPVLTQISQSSASTFRADKISADEQNLAINVYGASSCQIKSVEFSVLKADVAGASTISMSSVKANDFDIEVCGASDVDILGIDASVISLEVSGASGVELEGRTNQFDVEASGASDVNAKSLAAACGSVRASGASDVEVNIDDMRYMNSNGASSIKNEK